MKIALVNKYWFIKGGAERVLFLTRDALIKQGHTVVMFGMQHPDNIVKLSHPVPFLDVKKPSLFDFWRVIYNRQAKKMFLKFLKDEKPDVIHFHNIYHQLSFSLFDAARECGVPTVMTLHDYQLFSPNYMLFLNSKPYYKTLGGSYYRCIGDKCMGTYGKSVAATLESYMRAICKKRFKPDRLIAPSEYMRAIALECGYSSDSVALIQNPILSISVYETQKQTSEPYAVFVGRFVEEKGIKRLLEAFSLLKDIPLVLVGDGPCMDWVKRYISDHNMTHVSIRGWCDEQMTRDVVAGATVSVFPSQWPENCPMAVLESIQLGVLPVGSSLGGLIELLPTEFQFTYDSQEETMKVINYAWSLSNEVRDQKVKILQDNVLQCHSVSLYVDSIIHLYETVCEKAG